MSAETNLEDDPSTWPRADLDPSQEESQRRIDAATVHSTSSLRARLRALADRWDLEGRELESAELRRVMGSVL